MNVYKPLQLREVFHLEFLRWFGRSVEAQYYALKEGSNLRFFFNSIRYSEDMDLEAHGIKKDIISDAVMGILKTASFQDALKPFSIERVVPPDIAKAKQTETTQRFKIHLMTFAGEDLFTKIEFSRRGFKGDVIVQPVEDKILRPYRLPPLVAPHYNIYSAMMQKIGALSGRTITQARDIFDLYILIPQRQDSGAKKMDMDKDTLSGARDNLFAVSFEQFKGAVIHYLSPEDQQVYNNKLLWDEIVLKVSNFIDELLKR